MRIIHPTLATDRAAHFKQAATSTTLTRVYPAKYVRNGSETISPEVMHATRVFAARRHSTSGVVCGVSAAVLHGIPVRRRYLDGPITINRKTTGTQSVWTRVSRAKLQSEDITEVAGLPVTSIGRTLLDLAGLLPLHDLVAAVDGAFRLGADVPSFPAGKRHSAKLRLACEYATGRSESFAESLSNCILLDAGFSPAQQMEIFDTLGEFVARADFMLEEGVLCEFDGRVKYDQLAGSAQEAARTIMLEKDRENRLRELGWEIVRWGWADLADPSSLTKRIQAAVARAKRNPSPRGAHALAEVRRVLPPNWDAFE